MKKKKEERCLFPVRLSIFSIPMQLYNYGFLPFTQEIFRQPLRRTYLILFTMMKKKGVKMSFICMTLCFQHFVYAAINLMEHLVLVYHEPYKDGGGGIPPPTPLLNFALYSINIKSTHDFSQFFCDPFEIFFNKILVYPSLSTFGKPNTYIILILFLLSKKSTYKLQLDLMFG